MILLARGNEGPGILSVSSFCSADKFLLSIKTFQGARGQAQPDPLLRAGPDSDPILTYDPACLVKSPKPPEKITKKYKIPHPGSAPKIRRKYRKNTKMVIFGPFSYFFGIFFVFLGPDPGWGILYFFFVIFSHFWGSGGFGLFARQAGW